ncbi:MAG: tRNA (adenosine(37)-N6)-dimethylallyltransferase MiaA [Bacteroidaceae bacterium]|nr:tRNA (adenosine(37)-N6)-dimethylallyltransferase MiaA [Bacteroidaceae bacterium]
MKTLLVIVGPTGVGKTELSLRAAEYFSTSILNADSRQLYRDIPIGTAAPTAEDLSRVPHHFVGTLNLDDYYSAARYESEAISLLERLFAGCDTVVLSGGSMLYVDAVCQGIDDIPTISDSVRQQMRERYENEGLETLAAELERLDPAYFAQCDIRNPNRVIHALEICHMTGRTYTSFRVRKIKERPFRIIKIGLCRERGELFGRIGRRTDQMLSVGLLDEARRVLPHRDCNSLNTVGYKELFKYLDGEWTLDFALEKIKRNTRVYAKKQMTWFKKDPEIAWFHPDNWDEVRFFIQNRMSADE